MYLRDLNLHLNWFSVFLFSRDFPYIAHESEDGVQNMAQLYLELAGYINIILEKGILRIQILRYPKNPIFTYCKF